MSILAYKETEKMICESHRIGQITAEKTPPLERHSKGQFCVNTVYFERGMPYFAFVSTNAVLVRKIDKL